MNPADIEQHFNDVAQLRDQFDRDATRLLETVRTFDGSDIYRSMQTAVIDQALASISDPVAESIAYAAMPATERVAVLQKYADLFAGFYASAARVHLNPVPLVADYDNPEAVWESAIGSDGKDPATEHIQVHMTHVETSALPFNFSRALGEMIRCQTYRLHNELKRALKTGQLPAHHPLRADAEYLQGMADRDVFGLLPHDNRREQFDSSSTLYHGAMLQNAILARKGSNQTVPQKTQNASNDVAAHFNTMASAAAQAALTGQQLTCLLQSVDASPVYKSFTARALNNAQILIEDSPTLGVTAFDPANEQHRNLLETYLASFSALATREAGVPMKGMVIEWTVDGSRGADQAVTKPLKNITMNLLSFAGRPIAKVLGTLAHEGVHQFNDSLADAVDKKKMDKENPFYADAVYFSEMLRQDVIIKRPFDAYATQLDERIAMAFGTAVSKLVKAEPKTAPDYLPQLQHNFGPSLAA